MNKEKRFDGRISEHFDLVTQTVPSYFELESFLANCIAQQYRNPIVIDIGVGTGITIKAIIERNPGCEVTGLEYEPIMVEQACRNLSSEIAQGVADVRHTDALDYLMNIAAGSIDVVASAFTLHNCLGNYRSRIAVEVFRILRPGGMFINSDKYAADDRAEYVKELTDQIIRYDALRELGDEDLRRIWVEHEIADQVPERIMWTQDSIQEMRKFGFVNVLLGQRIGQYAILTAYKP